MKKLTPLPFQSYKLRVTSYAFCFLLSAFFLFPNTLFAQRNKEIKGNGKLTTQSIPISNFSKIEVETFVEIDYSQGRNTGNLEFTVDNNLLEYYDIYTENDVLRIQLKNEYKNKHNLKPSKSLLKVSSDQLEKISIAGGSKVNFCTNFTSKKLNIELAGSAKILANKYSVNITNLKADIAGSASVQLNGTIQKADVSIAGSGSVKALDCKIAQLQADIAGSGNVEAHVTDTLIASIAGSGKVRYKGNPSTIKPSVAGSGKVVKL
ncbi:MAG: DUF2807 domain-containing protein [Bacteroidetes bacterium]|nr:DUF2807 domain-containing protein [Bacteroidota bacterium]MCL2302961.1 DUF2807 domain-containing protein [Lentimicrobiaceae bacterium]